jgi:tetratricopeptide (TPR) repeat protein
VALWAFAGLLLTAIACFPRLHAEYYWARARILELQGDHGGARAALDRAVGLMPAFASMERTWLLAGKLDYYEGKTTLQERFFKSHQLAYDRQRPLAKAFMRDEDSATGGKELAVRRQLSKILVDTGLTDLRKANSVVQQEDAWRPGVPYFNEPGFYPPRIMAAQEAWQEAAWLLDWKRRNAFFYLGETTAHNDRYRPEVTEAAFSIMLDHLADRVLRADIQSTLGNAYFEAGDFNEARKRYQQSIKAFMLPKIINYRGQKGLGGL